MKFIVFTILLVFVSSYAFADDSTKQKQTLPSVQVKTLDGKVVHIQDYVKTGNLTILFFWETTCKPSAKALDNILDLYDQWQTKYKCDLLAISIDDPRNSSKVKPFVTGKGWPFTILTDENRDLARAINIGNCPYILILDQNGYITYRHYGYVEGVELELEEEMIRLKS